MGDVSSHGIASSRDAVAKSVTHVAGQKCYPCRWIEPFGPRSSKNVDSKDVLRIDLASAFRETSPSG
jgi:hypothetical protein